MFQKVVDIGKFLLANWDALVAAIAVAVGALVTFLVGVGAIFTLVPGEQPEKTIFRWADLTRGFGEWIKKFSRKKEGS